MSNFDLKKIRDDFPILQSTVHGKPLVYLDNAATAQKPTSVLSTLEHYYSAQNANVHRGIHHLSQVATTAYEAVRDQVQQFLGAASRTEIIFTRNASESINLVAQTYGRANLQAGDEILLSEMEHHSNLVPWQMIAQERGAQLRFIEVNSDGIADLSTLDTLITEKTKIVSLTMLSNVLGYGFPIKDIAARAHQVGAVVVVDASQSAVHGPINVQDLNCDFLVCTGHKLYGPTGVGVLYGKKALLDAMPPFLGGGEMIDVVGLHESSYAPLPAKFEAGTPNIAGVIALGEALRYCEQVGWEHIAAHEAELIAYAYEQLKAQGDITIYGYGPEDRQGVIAFNLAGIHPHDVSQTLDFEGVAIRAGHHCCQPLMKKLGLAATNRLSVAMYNTKEDIDRCIAALDVTRKFFKKAV